MTGTRSTALVAKDVLKLDREVLEKAIDGWLQTTGSGSWGRSFDLVKADTRAGAVQIILDALCGVFGHIVEPDQAFIARNEALARIIKEAAAWASSFEDNRARADSPSTMRHTLGDPSEG